MNQTDFTGSITDIAASLSDIFGQGIRSGLDMFQSLNQTGASMLTQVAAPVGASRGTKTSRAGCSCTIPAPCWMPQPLGELTVHACAGGTATLRVRVTNCGMQETTVSVDAKTASGVKFEFDPPSLALGAMERGVISANARIPSNANNGEEFESLIWIHGCRDYYLRYIIKVAARGTDCCHEIDVDDCPDLVHHWYDHFYCPRHCRRQARQG